MPSWMVRDHAIFCRPPAGGLNIPLAELSNVLGRFLRRLCVFVCRSGNRSQSACEWRHAPEGRSSLTSRAACGLAAMIIQHDHRAFQVGRAHGLNLGSCRDRPALAAPPPP